MSINEQTPITPSDYDKQDIEQNKIWAILAYVSILFFLPLVVCPQSRFGRYHANQGLVLLLCGAAGSIVSAAISWVPFIGWIIGGALGTVWGIATFVFMILGIINAANGKAEPLPLIGGIQIIK